MRYNIVLIPAGVEVSNCLIALAHEASVEKDLKTHYLLNDKDKISLPHISVIQFKITCNQNFLESIWQQISETWQRVFIENNKSVLKCTLPQVIHYRKDFSGENITWSEIKIDKNNNRLLQQFHNELLKKLKPFGIECLNKVGGNYSPHFTLFNVHASLAELRKSTELLEEIPQKYWDVLKLFALKPALGKANESGELVAVIKCSN